MTDLLPHNPEDKLEEALALLVAGIPAAEILAQAGDDAEWLRPLLSVAAEVGQLRAAMPLPNPEASLQRMLSYSRSLTDAPAPPKLEPNGWLNALVQLLGGGWLPRLAASVATALVVVFLLGGTLVVLAQRSLPGHPLYAIKRMGETLQLALTQDSALRRQLQENFNQRRQDEVQLLLKAGEAETVAFEGKVEALTNSSVTLDGLTVRLTPQTKIDGLLALGARVNLNVMTQPPDQLVALAISVVEPAPLTPTPLPTSTATATLTPTLTPPATATATPGQSQTSDTLNLPTRTPTATPTPLPPSPTPTNPPPPPAPTEAAPPTAAPAPAEKNNTHHKGGDDQAANNNEDNSGGGNDNADDNSGNDNADDNSGDHSGSDDSNSGSGGSDDHSGSNSGSGGSDDGDSSGSGKSGGDDH